MIHTQDESEGREGENRKDLGSHRASSLNEFVYSNLTETNKDPVDITDILIPFIKLQN